MKINRFVTNDWGKGRANPMNLAKRKGNTTQN